MAVGFRISTSQARQQPENEKRFQNERHHLAKNDFPFLRLLIVPTGVCVRVIVVIVAVGMYTPPHTQGMSRVWHYLRPNADSSAKIEQLIDTLYVHRIQIDTGVMVLALDIGTIGIDYTGIHTILALGS